MNTIVWATKAVRQFRKLPTADQRAIGDKVSGLAAWPDVLGVKHLVGRDQGNRVKIILYKISRQSGILQHGGTDEHTKVHCNN